MTKEKNETNSLPLVGDRITRLVIQGTCYKENCAISELEDTCGHTGICPSFQESMYSQCGVHQTALLVLSSIFLYNAG